MVVKMESFKDFAKEKNTITFVFMDEDLPIDDENFNEESGIPVYLSGNGLEVMFEVSDKVFQKFNESYIFYVYDSIQFKRDLENDMIKYITDSDDRLFAARVWKEISGKLYK